MDHLGRVHELVHDTEDEDLKRLPGKKGADQDPFQLIHEKQRMIIMGLFLTFESVVMITNND